MTEPTSSLMDDGDFVLYWDDALPQTGEDLTDEEAVASLSTQEGEGLDEVAVSVLLNSLVAAGDMHTGAMIALRPSQADIERLSADAHEPAGELHCTILYLGEAVLIDGFRRDAIIGEAARFAELKPITGDGFSVAVFNPSGDDSCIVLQVSGSTELVALRDTMFRRLNMLMGDTLPKQHVPYIPHVTLSYDADASLIPRLTHLTGPITFDAIRVAFGDEVIDIEFESEDEDD
jgi:2'-5' RNA ligase